MTAAPPAPQARRRRALVPREHGAWGQVLVPLCAALIVVGRAPEPPGSLAASMWVAAAALLAFLAHEPLLVLTGQRGSRQRTEEYGRARTLLILEALLCAASGVLAVWTMPAEARLSLLVPAVLGVATAAAALARAIKTLGGELLAAATLSSVSVPILTAGGKRLDAGLALWLILLTGFAQATLAVRALVGRLGPWPAQRATRVAAALIAPTLIVPLLLVAPGAPLLGAAFVPLGLVTLTVALLGPHPRHLRTVGWVTAAATVVSASLVVVALH